MFEKINSGKLNAVTSSATLEELAYVSLMRLIERKYKKHPHEVLRENRNTIEEFASSIDEIFTAIFSFNNLKIVEFIDSDLIALPYTMKKFKLLPRDAVHFITMRRLGCDKIVSTDSDFDNIQEIFRIDPKAKI